MASTTNSPVSESTSKAEEEKINKKRKLAEEESQHVGKQFDKRNSESAPLPKKSRIPEDMLLFCEPPANIIVTVKNGVRYLSPYWGVFKGYAKKRWIGRSVAEVFTSEFLIYHPLYPKVAIMKGRLFINGVQMCNPDYRFRTSDRFLHLSHRHETEIPALPIGFIDETDDFLVINKPPGLPVHPCGHYNIHSVMSLLKREYGREDSDKLRPLYRLDRNTTGCLMFAKNYQADIKFKEAIRKRTLQKEYVAKVEGIFPEDEVVCTEPIGVLSLATGIRCVKPDGQEATSRFRRLFVNHKEQTSVVSCQIETGRTHQIRVHLQFLGHPILHDDIYNDHTWGPQKGKGCEYGKTMEQLILDVMSRHNKNNWLLSTDPAYEKRLREVLDEDMCEREEHDLRKIKLGELPDYDPFCCNCAVYEKRQMVERDWQMLLHCWRYSGDGWTFEAPLPDWATPVMLIGDGSRQPQSTASIEESVRREEDLIVPHEIIAKAQA